MTDRTTADAQDITQLFNRVFSTKGLVRRRAFDELYGLVAAGQSGFEPSYRDELAELRGADVDSTSFEIDLRKLQTEMLGLDDA